MRVCHFATRPSDAKKVNTQIWASSTASNGSAGSTLGHLERRGAPTQSRAPALVGARLHRQAPGNQIPASAASNPLAPPTVTPMRSIARGGAHELEIQRSRFLCSVARVETPEQATDFIAAIRKQHWDATHNCAAFRVGPDAEQQRSNDDGEPAGTAGVPMLEVLARREITDTVAVVTRYFGGTKLGAGGLVRAYGRAVAETLDHVGTVLRVPHTTVEVTVDHPTAGRLDNELRTSGHKITDIEYGSMVQLTVLVPTLDTQAFARWLAEHTAGRAAIEFGDVILLDVPDPQSESTH